MTVFDASALLAVVKQEAGGRRVAGMLDESATVSAANWAEVAQKVRQAGLDWPEIRAILFSFGLDVEPVDSLDAERAAEMWDLVRSLSLADRLCLALGERLGEPVVTADRAWAGLPGVTVIR